MTTMQTILASVKAEAVLAWILKLCVRPLDLEV